MGRNGTPDLVANILIIGINYRPETTGIAPYTSDLAEHLAATGHRVTVITGFAHYPAWRLEPGDSRMRAVESRNGVRVVRRRHYVPRSQSAIRRGAYEATFLVHGALSRPERPDVVFGVIPSLSGGLLARYFAARALAAKLRIGTSLPTEASQPARALHRAARFVKRAQHASRSVEWRLGSLAR